MATIIIVGDSWGTINGMAPEKRRQNPHLAELLKNKGHRVTNVSIPGGSNGQSMAAMRKHVKKIRKRMPYDVDYVIWFHTESLRDRYPDMLEQPFDIMELTRQQASMLYIEWRELLKKVKARDIIIGGQAPVITNLLVHEPYHMIEDWRSELLNIPSVMTHSICHHDLFEHPNCTNSYEDRLAMLADNERIVDMERKSPLFPDDAHPGGEAHQALFERIQPLIHK